MHVQEITDDMLNDIEELKISVDGMKVNFTKKINDLSDRISKLDELINKD
jgi:hypothetical protein